LFSCIGQVAKDMISHSAPKDQDYGRLEKGRTFTKYLWITHPTNVGIESHSVNNPKEPTTNVKVIWTTKTGTNFVNEGTIIKKKDVFQDID
jgi:hypothetical protein